ncbi:Transposon protein [Arachis hypogaea]|nr:Transposon protein [Arachis hypogaea]
MHGSFFRLPHNAKIHFLHDITILKKSVNQSVVSNRIGRTAYFIEHLVCTVDHIYFAEVPNHGVNSAPDIVTIAESNDEFANEGIREVVGAVEEMVDGGEERMREKGVGYSSLIVACIRVVVGVGLDLLVLLLAKLPLVSSFVLFPSFLTRFFFVIYIMDDSTSDCQLNPGEVDYEFESNEISEPLSVVDDQFVPKVGMTFTTLEDAEKFYRNYAKAAERENGNLKYLKQDRELSMFIRRTIENNEEAGIRPSKTYQSFVAAAGGHRELNFIEKNISMKTVIYGFQSIWITTSGQG